MIKNPRTKYGTIYFDEKRGYVISSRKEGNRGKMLHRLIWEDHYGEIPQNCCIIFKDGDKTNLQLSNLELKKKQDGIDTEFGRGYLKDTGYIYVNHIPLHHLIWEKHYGKRVPKGYHVHHKDENKSNNCVANLEWCDTLYNNNYYTKIPKVYKYGSYNNKKYIALEQYKVTRSNL